MISDLDICMLPSHLQGSTAEGNEGTNYDLVDRLCMPQAQAAILRQQAERMAIPNLLQTTRGHHSDYDEQDSNDRALSAAAQFGHTCNFVLAGNVFHHRAARPHRTAPLPL